MLAGGGHAHVGVLQAIARNRPRETDVVLVTPGRAMTYSGMLPGWMAGDYTLPELQVDVAALAERAGVQVVLASIAGLDAMRRNLVLADGRAIPYDLLSLDVGSEPDLAPFVALGDRALPIRPAHSRHSQASPVQDPSAGRVDTAIDRLARRDGATWWRGIRQSGAA